MANLILCIILQLVVFVGGISVEKHDASTPKEDLDVLKQILDLTSELTDGIYEFFITYGPDEELGGFYTLVDQFGIPDPEQPKNILMQSRALYVAAMFILEDRYPPEDKQRLIDLMNGQFDFIKKYFYAPHTKQFHYLVTADGSKVIDGDQRGYYTAFAIWGLSHYVLALRKLGLPENAEEPLKMAMEAYMSMHNRLYDSEYGGYDQTKENNWFYYYGIEANRNLGNEWAKGSKGANTQMHTLEALTGLYIASGDEFIRKMLEQLLDIHVNILLKDHPYQMIVATRNWTSLTEHQVVYGHDIELAHLMQDAGAALDYQGVSEDSINDKTLAVVKNVQFFGIDRVNRGVFYSGIENLGPTSYIKAFWVQVESALGFWRAYLISGDISFLNNMLDTLEFYKEEMLNDLGEFYWEFNLYQPDTRGPDLYETWKQSYHNVRCFLTIIDEIETFLGN